MRKLHRVSALTRCKSTKSMSYAAHTQHQQRSLCDVTVLIHYRYSHCRRHGVELLASKATNRRRLICAPLWWKYVTFDTTQLLCICSNYNNSELLSLVRWKNRNVMRYTLFSTNVFSTPNQKIKIKQSENTVTPKQAYKLYTVRH